MAVSHRISHIQGVIKSKNLLCGIFFSAFLLLSSACQPSTPACPPESVTYLPEGNLPMTTDLQDNQNRLEQLVEIRGEEILVDQVIQGVLCSGDWSGIVYVPCEVQVYAWDEEPLFLKNCDINIAPNTTVYVAAHNNEPYYQGCSCHTGEVNQ